MQFFLFFSNLNSKSGLSVLAYTAPNQQFQILRMGLSEPKGVGSIHLPKMSGTALVGTQSST